MSNTAATATRTWKTSGHMTPQRNNQAVCAARSLIHSMWTCVNQPSAAQVNPASGRKRPGGSARRPICNNARPATAHDANIQDALKSSSCMASAFAASFSLARALLTISAAEAMTCCGCPKAVQSAPRSTFDQLPPWRSLAGKTAAKARAGSPSSNAAMPSSGYNWAALEASGVRSRAGRRNLVSR